MSGLLVDRGPAVLVLEDGRVFHGEAYGADGETVGEAVFATGMTGYQETLTDPSYHRQVVVMTAPHVGNTGVNDEDDESARIWVAGYVVRDPALRPSSWRATGTLEDELRDQAVVGICGLDTRALTRHLRERGAMRVGIFSGEAAGMPASELLGRVTSAPPMTGADLAGQVTTPEPYVIDPAGQRRFVVAAVDLGIKGMTPALMSQAGIEVHVLPSTSSIDDVLAVGEHGPDGVFFSNGPGDPAAADLTLLRQVLDRRIPLFGICFGNQLLGRALGLGTYKLKYGHRGINQPVMDLTTGKVEVTAHNHGFAIAWEGEVSEAAHTAYGRVRVSHVCLNDDVVEGLECLDIPAYSVQYHPEAAAGPHDAAYLFERFTELMERRRPREPGGDVRAEGNGGARRSATEDMERRRPRDPEGEKAVERDDGARRSATEDMERRRPSEQGGDVRAEGDGGARRSATELMERRRPRDPEGERTAEGQRRARRSATEDTERRPPSDPAGEKAVERDDGARRSATEDMTNASGGDR